MNKMLALCLLVVSGHLSIANADDLIASKFQELSKTTLPGIANNPVVLKAVAEENAKGKSLEQIKERDAKWMAEKSITPEMTALMTSECGAYLSSLKKSNPDYTEIFVMDNQGANVCMSDKTSDYWQGDEAKFINSFAEGKGNVDISKIKFDESTQKYQSQISVPVIDQGKVIGAMTFGVQVEKGK